MGKRERWLAGAGSAVVVGILIACAAYFFFPARVAGKRTVAIEHGLTFAQIARRLEEQGIVRHALALRAWARAVGGDREVKAGTYEFPPGEPLWRVFTRLRSGDIISVRVTFPEGLTTAELAEIAARFLAMSGQEYLAAARNRQLVRELGVQADSLEGYLFPDTYYLAPGTHAEDLVRLQVRTFWSVFDTSRVARARWMGLSAHQAVTLASIVEREARLDAERPRIAAVFLNRLARGMRLQADPTVRFALGVWDRPLTAQDLEADSPWNTYRVAGLPPGPICNPGKASLDAVLFPQSGSQELYFVAQGDGSHYFSATNEEHARARAAFRRQRNR